MRLTYKYRAYANKETIANAERWIELCRRLYNAALEQRIAAYRSQHLHLGLYQQCKDLTDLRANDDEYNNVNCTALRSALEYLDFAFKSFYRRLKTNGKAGFPRFKSISRYDSFAMVNGWKLDGKYLRITRLGTFKLKLSRDIQGNIKTVTIKRDRLGRFYVCFNCDGVPNREYPFTHKSVGIDVGIKSLAVDSDNKSTGNPNYLRRLERRLKLRNRRLSRRIKGSNHHKRARILVAKTHTKAFNQRQDYLHKLSTQYITKYDFIYVEDLHIKGIVQNRYLARSVQDSGWGIFIGFLEYKAAEAGKSVIRIPRFEPTSKRCSECGAINSELKLSDRKWVCQSCGAVHDRDFNAAKNILRVGQTLQALTCASGQSVACESQKENVKRSTMLA